MKLNENGKKLANGSKIVIEKGYKSGTPSLLVILIVLKAIGILKWSWFWTIAFPILLPLIAVFSILAVIGIGIGLLFLGAMFLDAIGRKRRRYNFKRRR